MQSKSILLAFATFLLAPHAASADSRCPPIKLSCSGFEPNWSFVMPRDGTLRFSDPNNPDWETKPLEVNVCAAKRREGAYEIDSESPLDLKGRVTRKRCVEESGKRQPYTINMTFNAGATSKSPTKVTAEGCCWR